MPLFPEDEQTRDEAIILDRIPPFLKEFRAQVTKLAAEFVPSLEIQNTRNEERIPNPTMSVWWENLRSH